MDSPALWLQALLYGLLSALSLPIGAMLGIVMAPVPPRTTARWMAFGSGALVFAVATQLYGELLAKLSSVMHTDKVCGEADCRQRFRNIFIQTAAGLAGSIMYVVLNKALERAFGDAHGGGHGHGHGHAPGPGPGALHLPPGAGQGEGRRGSLGTGGAGPLRGGSRPDSFMQRVSFPLRLSWPASVQLGELPEPMSGTSFRGAPVRVEQGSSNVALSMWLGLLLDGIPEALMLGFMTNEDRITYVFLGAIFIANFPEAFSGASILVGQGMKKWKIFTMWSVVFLVTGVLAMVGSLIMPANIQEGSLAGRVRDSSTAALEGLTGGAMLAMVATAMLPEAFRETGQIAGIFFVLGFVISVLIDGLGTRLGK